MIVIVFLIGSFGYMGLELLWRGHTHWTMGLAGGICVTLLYTLFQTFELNILTAFLLSSVLITTVEFVFGYILNICLGMAVWDYSKMKHNIMGQICLTYSTLWGLLGAGVWGALRLFSVI